jgi:hypothetical protein
MCHQKTAIQITEGLPKRPQMFFALAQSMLCHMPTNILSGSLVINEVQSFMDVTSFQEVLE